MMAKRECGSCRFFEKSGIGASGHCRNERCKDIVGIALVRKYELACRVGWDRDFYEPLAGTVPTIPGEDRPRLDATRPRGYQGLTPDDMVVAVEQTRPVNNDTPVETTRPSSRSRQSHVGEAHRRALERKQIAQRNGAPLPPRRLEGVIAPTVPQFPVPTPTEDWGTVEAEGVSLPRRTEGQPAISTKPFIGTPNVDVNAETAALPITPSTSTSSRRMERQDIALVPSSQETNPEWSRPLLAPPGLPSITPTSPQSDFSIAATEEQDSVPSALSGTSPRYPLPEGVEPESLRAEWYLAERKRHRGKRCGNCRDFRPAETGERGYCRNRFAFPAPQLVAPSDLACLSCLGTWWAASDQWWLQHAQVSSPDAPTPQADQILDELRSREEQERPERHPYTG